MIIVDDCSTDNTVKIVREITEKDPRIKLLINGGIDAVDKLKKPSKTYSEKEQFDICDEAKCTGCGACYAICPRGAIAIKRCEGDSR